MPTAGAPPGASHEPCVGCGSPLDERQRYCVTCGTRRRSANDPAARFLSSATRRQRNPAVAQRPGSPPRRRGASLATALAVAAIPAALGVGVLIGRSSNNNDAGLLAAVKADRSPIVAASSGATSGAATSSGSGSGSGSGSSSASGGHPVSTYALARGYAVQLSTLPSASTAAAAAKVEHTDRSKGAPSVGVIAQSDFQVSPRPPAGAYVVYSGAYSNQADAQKALAKLKHSFPAAKVISVRSHSAAAAAAPVLSKTHFGSAHKIASYKPSSSALSQGANVAKQDSHSTGKAASGSGLPDVVAVP